MRVILIDTLRELNRTGKFCRHSQLEPLALEYIASIVKDTGHEPRIIVWGQDDCKVFAKKLIDLSPDIICFSTFTYTIDRTLELAQELKRHSHKLVIILGGYHMSGHPHAVKNTAIDLGVIGEGEATFKDIIQAIENGFSIKGIPGTVSYDKKFYWGPKRDRITDLDRWPWPLRDRKFLASSRIYSAIYPPPSEQHSVAAMVASRGCQYSCPFCLSPLMWRHQIVQRNSESVVKEMIYLYKTFGTNLIHFADVNFVTDKEWCLDFCIRLQSNRNINIFWTASATITDLDSDLTENLKKAGCTRLSFGIETIDSLNHRRLKPGHHLSMEQIQERLSQVREAGIFVRGFFILGSPWETRSTLRSLENDLENWPIDDLRLAFLSPFPGTQLYKQLNQDVNEKLTSDFSRYSSEEPILNVGDLSFKELIDARSRIANSFYSSAKYRKRMAQMVKLYPNLEKSYNELFQYLHKRGVSCYNKKTKLIS